MFNPHKISGSRESATWEQTEEATETCSWIISSHKTKEDFYFFKHNTGLCRAKRISCLWKHNILYKPQASSQPGSVSFNNKARSSVQASTSQRGDGDTQPSNVTKPRKQPKSHAPAPSLPCPREGKSLFPSRITPCEILHSPKISVWLYYKQNSIWYSLRRSISQTPQEKWS